MRLVLTGGGTGGHIYPALVVGQVAADSGAELLYFGSLRGQESKACQERGIPFTGFPSEPLYSLRTVKGLKALAKLLKARRMARVALQKAAPNALFSTGGYSAGPVVMAARDLGIPYVIHTADSIPARSSSMFASQAKAFTCTFRSTIQSLPDLKPIRTGQPIRPELRAAVTNRTTENTMVLVMGGSQGSAFLNSTVPKAALKCQPDVHFLHVSGPSHFAATSQEVARLNMVDQYSVVPFLPTELLVEAFRDAAVVVCRSGGTLAELALFGLPSVLVPLPNSANDHQLHNAEEFVRMNAAILVNEEDATPSAVASGISMWLSDADRRETAKRNLVEWDIPDAADRIFGLIRRAAT